MQGQRMQKLKWGVLGCSSFARRRSIPAMLQAQSVDLLAVASRTKEKAESFQSEFDLKRSYGTYDELLDDPEIDAVHITTVNGLHCEWMLRAVEKGKHVLCEKPFTTSLLQAEKVAAQAAGTKLHVMEGLVWRVHPQHIRAIEAIEQGVIGAIRLVRAAFTFQLQDPTIRCHPVLGGGSVLDVGGYPVSSARFYLRAEPTVVNARGYIHPDYDVDMHMTGLMQFDHNVALMDCGFDAPFRTDLEIVGDKGRIYFPKAWQPPEEATIFINEEPVNLPRANHYVLMFEQFSSRILDGADPDYGIVDAVAQMKTVDAILRSIRSAKPEQV